MFTTVEWKMILSTYSFPNKMDMYMYLALHHFLNFQKKKNKDPHSTGKLSMHHHATVDQNERKLKCKFYVPQSYNIINYAIFGIKFDFSTG